MIRIIELAEAQLLLRKGKYERNGAMDCEPPFMIKQFAKELRKMSVESAKSGYTLSDLVELALCSDLK